MTDKVRYLVLPLMVVALTSGIYFGTSHKNKNGQAKVLVSNPANLAPDFTLTDLNGNQVRLSNYRGKVVILDFWATWCIPCRVEVPHFKELYSGYNNQGLEVIGVALDEGGAGAVKSFVDENRINYTIVLSDERIDQAYGNIH